MKARILVYSPETELRDAFTDWSRQENFGELLIVDQPEALPDVISDGDLIAVILDDSDGDLPLTALTHDLALQIPLARILVYPPPAETDQSEIKDAILHGYLSKPFSPQELNTALRGLPTLERADLPDATETELETIQPPSLTPTGLDVQNPGHYTPPVKANPADDLDFLKGWIFEETEEENTTPAPRVAAVIEQDIPQALTDLSGEAFDTIDTAPVEFNESASETVTLPEVAAATDSAEAEASVQSITPAELLTLKSSLPRAPESESVTKDGSDQTEAGLAPVNIHSYRLHYSCVLIPLDPKHYLVGELAERLSLVLPQIHLKRGWRVTGISIRPQYIQWSADIPLDVSPVEAVIEIRQQTSSCVLANLPELKSSGADEDFWAPGYLILSGNRATPPSIIREFIQRTRIVRYSES